jgi:hypothetical protein
VSDKRDLRQCGLCDEVYNVTDAEAVKRHEHPDPQSGPLRAAWLASGLPYERWIQETPEGRQWAAMTLDEKAGRSTPKPSRTDKPEIQRYAVVPVSGTCLGCPFCEWSNTGERYDCTKGYWDILNLPGWCDVVDKRPIPESCKLPYDLAPYVAAKVKEAVEKERKRCREQEAEPLMVSVCSLLKYATWQGSDGKLYAYPEKVDAELRIAAVRKAQEAKS